MPSYIHAGESSTSLSVSSNGYLVLGTATAADNSFINQNLPDPNPPKNVLAAFWTDLNPAAAGAVRIATLTDGLDTWIVVDWEGVREFSTPGNLHSFQIWIGIYGDAHPGMDVSYVYGPQTGNGDGGLLTVGAENEFGNRGGTTYFNGAGTLPGNGTEAVVTGAALTPGESRNVTYMAEGVDDNPYVNRVELSSDIFQGAYVVGFPGECCHNTNLARRSNQRRSVGKTKRRHEKFRAAVFILSGKKPDF